MSGTAFLAAFALGGSSCSVGLRQLGSTDACELDVITELDGSAQSQRALELLNSLMTSRRCSRQALRAVAFDAGPGSFTGLRVACSIAQGLAFGLGIEVIPIAAGEALAWEAARHYPEQSLRSLGLQDARMGEIYGSLVDITCDRWGRPIELTPVVAPWICAPAELSARVQHALGRADVVPRVHCVTGDAVKVHNGLFDSLSEVSNGSSWHLERSATVVTAAAVAELAAWYFGQGKGLAPEAAGPVYIRDKVALDVNEQQALRRLRQGL